MCPQPPTSRCRVAVLFLQPHCNMSCTFCITEDGFDVMTPEQARELVEELQRRGVETVTFGGGEPFVWPGDVVQLARHARSLGLRVQVGTNAVALPRGFAQLDCIDRFVLPLESVRAEVHDAMRRHRAGHHALILERLLELGRAGKTVTLSTVVTSVNWRDVEELGRWLRDYHQEFGNVHAWHLYQFLPEGRGGRAQAQELCVPPQTYRDCCERAKGLGLDFHVFRRSDMYRSRTVAFYWSQGGLVVAGESGSEVG